MFIFLSLSLLISQQTQNNVYELVSDMNQKQELLEERIVALEERLGTIHEQLEGLPEILNRVIQSSISAYRLIPEAGGGHSSSQDGSGPRHTYLHPNDASFGRPSWSATSLTGSGTAAPVTSSRTGGVT